MKRKPDPHIGRAAVEELYRLFPEQSNRKIAGTVGVRPYTLTDWLNGQSPSATILARLHHLGADVIYILTGVRN